MFGALRDLLGGIGRDVGNAAYNTVDKPLLKILGIREGSKAQPSTLPAASTPLMALKAQPIGGQPVDNSASMNYNQNAMTHLNPLSVRSPIPWQQGQLNVQQPVASPGGAYISPFDTDNQPSPFQFGSRNNYMGTGQQVNPQLLRGLLTDRG